jgi:hypothetical protein
VIRSGGAACDSITVFGFFKLTQKQFIFNSYLSSVHAGLQRALCVAARSVERWAFYFARETSKLSMICGGLEANSFTLKDLYQSLRVVLCAMLFDQILKP